MDGKFVSYIRVSTERQGRSGLGLDAQRADVIRFLNGGNWKLMGEHVEVESGKNAARPQLNAALNLCKLTGATLLVAKLDRLSRDAHFLIGLQNAGVEFVAVDMPHANKLTVGIMALVAQQEREAISIRTKAALAAAKARGTTLGGFRGVKVDSAAGRAAQVAKADAFASDVLPLVRQMQDGGLSLSRIAVELEQKGIHTARGGAWTAQGVKNLLARSQGGAAA